MEDIVDKTRQPEVTGRERVLGAAIEAFGRGGYEGTSTRDIADAAGLTVSLLFYHFKSKAELYIAAVECQVARIVEQLEAGISGEDGAYRQLERFVDIYLDCFIDYVPGLVVVNGEFFTLPPEVGVPLGRLYNEQVLERLRRVLSAGIESGAFRPVNVPACAIAIDAILKTFLRQQSLRHERAGKEEIAAQVLDHYALSLLPDAERLRVRADRHPISAEGTAGNGKGGRVAQTER